MSKPTDNRVLIDAHAEACERGDMTYVDPETGYSVFTSLGLRERGRCCRSGCRHCPYTDKQESIES